MDVHSDSTTSTAPLRARPAVPLLVGAPRPVSRGQVILRWGIVALCILGYWISFDLFRIAGQVAPTNPILGAVCGGGADSGCATLLQSEQAFLVLFADEGEPVLRVPWSILGMGYFAALGLWFALVGPVSRGAGIWAVPAMLFLIAGAWNSVALIHEMTVEIGQVCRGCLVAHAINGLILVFAIAAMPWRRREPSVLPYPRATHALAGVAGGGFAAFSHAVIGVAFFAALDVGEYRRALLDPEYAHWRYDRAPRAEIPARSASGAISAPADTPPHTVVMFSDFRCPQCRRTHATLRKFMAEHPGLIRLDCRQYPLDACNPYVTRGRHIHSCEAARSAEIVRVLGTPAAFESYVAILFERQAAIDPAHLREWALDVGVNEADYARRLQDEGAAAQVQQDIELAHSLGVRSTPAVYLDGKRVEGASRERTWYVILGVVPAGSAPAVPSAPE